MADSFATKVKKSGGFKGDRDLPPRADHDDSDNELFARAKDFLFGKPTYASVPGDTESAKRARDSFSRR